jgi:DNA-binding transcriptional MerR regulator
MDDSLTIDEVARRTGLSARALRFYEARGLVAPLRTGSGRRLYSQGELERLHEVVALKRAGFTLSAIARLFAGRTPRLYEMLSLQLEAIERQRHDLDQAAGLIRTALSRIALGEPLDAATLCSLIRNGDTIMTDKQHWQQFSASYLGEQAKADFAAMPMPEDFDQAAYGAKWADLGARIKAALPLDPAGAAAQGFVAEWRELLGPFTAVASPAIMQGVTAMYDDMPAWQPGSPSPGFDAEVWQFIQQAGAAARGT